MLKFVNTGIVFAEIPDEVTLSINISACPCHCPGCHSQYLWADIGEPLTPNALTALVKRYTGSITCVCLMGGDADPQAVAELAAYVREKHPRLKVAWFSGRARVPAGIDRKPFHYIKTGPYIRHLGALDSERTNQRMMKQREDGTWEDITWRFWQHGGKKAVNE